MVIAILATITIVAYNGITNEAKASSAKSAVSQAVKKVQLFAVTNSDMLPETLAEVGVSDDSNATYQYRTYNDGENFCLTATSQNTSYYIDNDGHSSPTAGACDGHAPNGGSTNTVTVGAWNGNYAFRSTAGSAGFGTAPQIIHRQWVQNYKSVTIGLCNGILFLQKSSKAKFLRTRCTRTSTPMPS